LQNSERCVMVADVDLRKQVMKGSKKNLLSVLVLSLILSPVWVSHLAAQPFTTLYAFTNGTDGANPYGVPYGLVLSGSTLYGTANAGGSNGSGSVFAIQINGTGFTNLYSFTPVDPSIGTNADGAEPNGVILSGGTLYGTTYYGGSNGNGTIFALSTNGTFFSNLYTFPAVDQNTGANNNGAVPSAALVLSGNTLYGTATYGGAAGNGTIFSIGTNGQNFTPMHSFSELSHHTNADGANPQQALVLSGGTLYGTAQYGGSNGFGSIFAISTGGSGFTNLYAFSVEGSAPLYANPDGVYPNGLVLSGSMLYGTANSGGSNGSGSVFGIGTNGSGFTNLYSFTATNIEGDNNDGAYPFADVTIAGSTIYGTPNTAEEAATGRCSRSIPMERASPISTGLQQPIQTG
jgi:uncharacterized repeat protein (TIGR03803 family)